MRDPKRKCIAKKCDDCQFYQSWDMMDEKTGLRKLVNKCGIQVLFEEIPRLRGSIDGVQQASNETRNDVLRFSQSAIKSIKIAHKKLIEG